MASLRDVGKIIPEKSKSKVPFYSSIQRFEGQIREFKKRQHLRSFQTDKRFIAYEKKINEFHDKHKGQRCFVVGTGPSLNKTKLELLENEIVFGVNTFYKAMKQYTVPCTYYLLGDFHVLEDHYKEVLSLDVTLFLGGRATKTYLDNRDEYNKIQQHEPILIRKFADLRDTYNWKIKDLTKGAYACHQVVCDLGLQVPYHMGFSEVYLLGCDCDYSKGQHFDGEKFSFINPTTEKYWSETFLEYESIKQGYEADGRKIFNATPGGKLEVFDRVHLEDVLG